MYIEMNNTFTFTFRPTFTEMTLFIVVKIWHLITVLLFFSADVAITICQILNIHHGTPNLFAFFIEINNKRTFWPRFTEVVSVIVGKKFSIVQI